MVIAGEETDDRHHFAVIGMGVLMLVVLYAIGVQLTAATTGRLTPFEVYSLAFFGGVWSAMIVTFGLNFVAYRLWGIDIVRFGPPRGA